ncbi:glycosyltransferase domain-containing protein [Stutzerimonas stutzeri]|uniref:glycosyltransferase domain-containing protein n=1 Tax=Stutzerimonas stutzeri TaxID=316 RepID=UPI003B791C95
MADECNLSKTIAIKKNRLVVYTALFGDYDGLIDPPEKFEGCDFICFTDQKYLKSNIWDIRLVEECDLPPNMMNRRCKILPHLFLAEYEQSLYIDANVTLLKSPVVLSQKYLTRFDFVAPKHFARDCAYAEAKECIVLMKDRVRRIKSQMRRYKDEGLPYNFGLSENNILLRNHLRKNVTELMEGWWQEMQRESQRDQLSLPYMLWKSEMIYSYMDESARGNCAFFISKPHNAFVEVSFAAKLIDKLKFNFRRLIFIGFRL